MTFFVLTTTTQSSLLKEETMNKLLDLVTKEPNASEDERTRFKYVVGMCCYLPPPPHPPLPPLPPDCLIWRVRFSAASRPGFPRG